MSGGSRHGKRTLKHTSACYVLGSQDMVNVHSSIHVYVMSGGATHGKRTLKHTRVRYVGKVKTW